MTRRNILAMVRLLFGLLVLIAIGWQLRIHTGLNFNVLNFFSYFTNLSNLLAALVFLFGAFRHFAGGNPTAASDQLRFMSATNMVVVGIVFALLLRNVDLGTLLPWVNTLLHYVMPCVVLLDWIIDPPQTRIGTSHLLRILTFPALYLTYTLLRGRLISWYPYPFLNPVNVGGYDKVAIYAIAITATFIVTALALMTVRNKPAGRATA